MHELDPGNLAIHSLPRGSNALTPQPALCTRPCLYFSTYFTLPCGMISGVHVHFFNQVPSSQGQEYYCLQHPVQNLACDECSEGLCENKGPESCGHGHKGKRSGVPDFGNTENDAHTEPRETTTTTSF